MLLSPCPAPQPNSPQSRAARTAQKRSARGFSANPIVDVTEAIFVRGPIAGKVNGTLEPILDHYPVPVLVLLVTEHLEGLAKSGLGMNLLNARVSIDSLRTSSRQGGILGVRLERSGALF